MTQAVLSTTGPSSTRILGAISAAHFVSHYYILLLAPLLPFVRADYGVSHSKGFEGLLQSGKERRLSLLVVDGRKRRASLTPNGCFLKT